MKKVAPSPDALVTLAEAREYVRRYASTGLRCPCCSSVVEIRERKITPFLGQGLILLARYFDHMQVRDNYIHFGDFLDEMHKRGLILGKKSGGDYAKLRFFDLIVPKKERKLGAVRSGGKGLWALTNLGYDFVRGLVSVPRSVFVYRNEVVMRSADSVSIADIVGHHRWQQLLSMPLNWGVS